MADWQAGDLALCVRASTNPLGNPQVCPGGVFTVAGAVVGFWGEPGLVLDGFPSAHSTGGHDATRFRKINPLTDEEREQFASDLNGWVPA